ncbi:hypothetical protein C2869_06645 [Saccharobesus litoralis]|uniref:Heparan-alpha-glucosaminide N-acetyltransferase catalytic domain-containing protein n=1 Tax=Saccharobesus litoralis TaxID=2172099 RepID=A0A2S0VPI8_9ALTE|nr:heparan-alpha-glucosaminide N-acetyltransferase domain-containing protein [Saccharobesus litoralis]AWB66137.1 hypothetical protein C2869_06645 [Saccharobesus litoralis]
MTNTLKTNTNQTRRILAFDFARGLAILFMVLIHVLHFYSQPQVRDTTFGFIIERLGEWPAAPIFVFIMGLFVAYTKSPKLTVSLQRAALLFLLGYLLNLTRGTIPMWLSLQLGLVSHEQLGGYSPLSEFLIVDILQFAAIALAICALLKRFCPNPKYYLILAALIILTSPYLWDLTTGYLWVDEALKLLWGNKHQGAMFPLLPWLAYPILGMVLGTQLKSCNNINALFAKTSAVGLVVLMSGILVTALDVKFHMATYMRAGPGATIMICGFVLIWLSLCHKLVNLTPPNRLYQLLYFWSQNVTLFYVIHWLYLGWGLMLFGVQQLNLISSITMMVAVTLASDLSTRAWLKFKARGSISFRQS